MSPTQRYIGSGPYCYANSLAMVLGPHAPDPSALEVLTGSPFGFEMLEGTLPLFDPLGWEPDTGLDDAIARLGWTCERHDGGGPDEAVDRLREASAAAPVLAGPVEMGLLLHQPGSGRAIGADHFVVVTEVTADTVCFHDPHGHPHATLQEPFTCQDKDNSKCTYDDGREFTVPEKMIFVITPQATTLFDEIE